MRPSTPSISRSFDSCLEDIIKNGTTRLPHFDFVSGRRSGFSDPITLGKDDVLIVEGIHALNPVITDSLPSENLMKLYVSVSSRISDEDGDVLMSKRDLRFVRRLVRDYYHRASSVERTYDLWGSVQRGEDKYIFPYSHLAAEKIDSLHAYEPCVFRALAVPMLSSVGSGSEWYDEAQMMIERLERFEPLPVDVIPVKLRCFVSLWIKLIVKFFIILLIISPSNDIIRNGFKKETNSKEVYPWQKERNSRS